MKFKNKKAFTLIEILIVITIIWILVMWFSNINLNTISDKQRAESFLNKVKNNIETVKNNALIWRWIWTDLFVPKQWKIEVSNNWNWKLSTSYYDWTNWHNYSEYSLIPEINYSIKNIECADFSWNTWSLDGWTNTWTIIITWWNLELSWCDDTDYKNIRITTSFRQIDKTFELNTISWVIQDINN